MRIVSSVRLDDRSILDRRSSLNHSDFRFDVSYTSKLTTISGSWWMEKWNMESNSQLFMFITKVKSVGSLKLYRTEIISELDDRKLRQDATKAI
ncbi:hypothetical protein KPH14_001941 [Odynerus spinipes]|uniref:Uncharacterized protein n=1 Tax=Odynerus spinipes TaxID=1348599 RepID=A0AAD9VXP6_9HYME|nr:hypothetical protein KPH14_001941 [Odynerus spinipes]